MSLGISASNPYAAKAESKSAPKAPEKAIPDHVSVNNVTYFLPGKPEKKSPAQNDPPQVAGPSLGKGGLNF